MYGSGISVGIVKIVMVDWNTFMRESLTNMMSSQEKRIEEETMEISRQQSKKNKEERTHSEEMQDKLEPIPCPMHEDYDNEKINA